jgi:flagellar FliJ protein
MKRYRFRLEQVLRIRRVQEEQARHQVHAAQRDVIRADQAVDDRLAAYAAGTSAYCGTQQAFMADRALAEYRAQSVERSRDNASAARVVHSERLDDWSHTARRVEALERFDARRRDEYSVEERRDEDRTVDEMVSGRRRPREDS